MALFEQAIKSCIVHCYARKHVWDILGVDATERNYSFITSPEGGRKLMTIK